MSYWNKVEEAYQGEKRRLATTEFQQSLELSEIVENIRRRLCPKVVEKVREEVRQTIPSESHDARLIEAETEARILSVIEPYAKRIQAEGKVHFKQNPMEEMSDQDQNRRWLRELAELLPQIQHGKNIIKKHTNLEEMLLYPTDLTALGSMINSWNNLVVELSQSGYQLSVFEPLPIPKSERMQWVQAVRNGFLLNDSELQEQNRLIATYLSRPITIGL